MLNGAFTGIFGVVGNPHLTNPDRVLRAWVSCALLAYNRIGGEIFGRSGPWDPRLRLSSTVADERENGSMALMLSLEDLEYRILSLFHL